jgi:acetylglutamate kinase
MAFLLVDQEDQASFQQVVEVEEVILAFLEASVDFKEVLVIASFEEAQHLVCFQVVQDTLASNIQASTAAMA